MLLKCIICEPFRNLSETQNLLFQPVLSDIPRNVDQIKNERKKIRNKGEFDDFATLLKLSSDNEFMHNLQWTPHPRAVVSTDSVVQDIVDNCTQPDSFQPFTIDTTFNIGPFYVTTTTYKHLKLIDKRSGKNPNLPGPALFHAKQNTGQFTYFAQTLNEMNGGISNILAIGSDHCNAFSDGLRTVCPLARVLICKKHVEDDIKRKMNELGIVSPQKDKILTDIFGNEREKIIGLIDSESPTDFEDKLVSLLHKWGKKEPLFARYFKVHIAKEMKKNMILCVRREAGLGDEFFYDNATESINHRYKVRIRETKKTPDPTGSKHLNCTMAEACQLYKDMLDETRRNIHRAVLGMGPYKDMLDETRRNIHRAVLGMGPYKLATGYESVRKDPTKWQQLTSTQKRTKLSTVDRKVQIADVTSTPSNIQMQTEDDITEVSQSNVDSTQCLTLCDFGLTHLPGFVKGSWQNVEKILKKNGVGAAPGDAKSRVVCSNSESGYHRVTVDKNCVPKACDCDRSKEINICAHIIATAHKENTLEKIISGFKVHMPSLLPTSNTLTEPRDVTLYTDPQRLNPSNLRPATNSNFVVVFVKDTRMQKCYGCGGTVRASLDVQPPAPWDIVLTRKEYRIYNRRGSNIMHISAKKENVYYHPKKKCIEKKNDDIPDANSIEISDPVKAALNEMHNTLLAKEFALTV